MTIQPAPETTARLVVLDPLARIIIMYLRLLRSGSRGRVEVEQDIAARAGPGSEQALGHLERLQSLICHAVRRPLDIGSVEDVRATKDEMMVAELVAAAAESRLEDCHLPVRGIAGPVRHEQLTQAAKLAAVTIATGAVARCSCGRTSKNGAIT